jgi:uncharacterized protein YdhG (YjbR/CyaY superfamily)
MSSKEVDSHISRIPEPQRSTLKALRRTIRKLIPNAEEVISYGFPGYKLGGKIICGFDAFKNHCSYFPHSSLVIPALSEELANYKTSKGALQFAVDKPLPASLVRKLIRTRIRLLKETKKN